MFRSGWLVARGLRVFGSFTVAVRYEGPGRRCQRGVEADGGSRAETTETSGWCAGGEEGEELRQRAWGAVLGSDRQELWMETPTASTKRCGAFAIDR
jgi:hypothetical protein